MISVVLAVYKGEEFIRCQINSILEAVDIYGSEVEIVVVDDCGNCDCVNIIQELVGDFLNTKVIRNESNCGVTASFMKGLEAAEGEIIIFSDQDDFWFSNKILRIEEAFLVNKSALLLAHSAVDTNGLIIQPRTRKGELFQLGCCLAVRKEIKRHILKFYHQLSWEVKADIGHDRVLCSYAAAKGRYVTLRDCLIVYRQHSTNNSTRKKRLGIDVAKSTRVRKNFDFYSQLVGYSNKIWPWIKYCYYLILKNFD